MPNELDPTQGEPEGETVLKPGEESPEPEQETENEASAEESGEGEQREEQSDEEKVSEKPKVSWETRRRIEETNKRRAAEKEAADLKAEVERLKAGKTDTPDVEQIRNEERQRIRSELQQQSAAEQFNAACNRTFEAGTKKFTDFTDARDALVDLDIGSKPAFLEAITDLPNGADVFYQLGKNPEEAERILALPPIKMAIEITRLGEKAAKPAPKKTSSAPPPVRPGAGVVETGTRLDDPNTSMDDFAKKFLTEVVKRA